MVHLPEDAGASVYCPWLPWQLPRHLSTALGQYKAVTVLHHAVSGHDTGASHVKGRSASREYSSSSFLPQKAKAGALCGDVKKKVASCNHHPANGSSALLCTGKYEGVRARGALEDKVANPPYITGRGLPRSFLRAQTIHQLASSRSCRLADLCSVLSSHSRLKSMLPSLILQEQEVFSNKSLSRTATNKEPLSRNLMAITIMLSVEQAAVFDLHLQVLLSLQVRAPER